MPMRMRSGKQEAPAARGEWVHGLLDCCSEEKRELASAVLCAPCMLGTVQGRLEGGDFDRKLCFDVSAVTVLGGIFGAEVAGFACWWAYSTYSWWQRHQVRKLHKIEGNWREDCLFAYCCTPCTATQNLAQLTAQPGYRACPMGEQASFPSENDEPACETFANLRFESA